MWFFLPFSFPPPLPRLCCCCWCSFFLHWCFPVGQVPVPFLLCGGSWLGWAVAPVMGALFQSRGWLPIVEAPGYSRHPTSILMMQLFTQHIMNFYFDSHQWSHKGHKVSLLRTKSHPMQQEKGKSLAIIIIDFKVNFAYFTFTDIIFIVRHIFKLSA